MDNIVVNMGRKFNYTQIGVKISYMQITEDIVNFGKDHIYVSSRNAQTEPHTHNPVA